MTNGHHNGTTPAPNGYEAFDLTKVKVSDLFDPAVLTRMANELFQDGAPAAAAFGQVPGAAEAEAIFSTYLPLSDAIPSADSAANQAAGYAPRVLPIAVQPSDYSAYARIPTDTLPSPGTLVPGVPGGLSSALYRPDASFGFLAEARPLFDESLELAFEFTLDGAKALDSAWPVLDAAMPAVLGAIAPATDMAETLLPGFLGSLRSLTYESQRLWGEGAQAFGAQVAGPSPANSGGFDVNAVRRDFPILNERVEGRPLVWLDNAATTQKPQSVIDRLSYFYTHENSNVHRGAHTLAARSTDAYEDARERVRGFLGAATASEIIFVRGTTEAINLVAQSWGRANIQRDDEILISWLEHHANIVPWQMLCAETGARLRVAPVDDSGQVILSEYQKLLGPRTKLVSIGHVSNALGTITPVQEMTALAHGAGARVLVDGAQAVSHMPVDVQAIGCDFYVFSGHKVFGPTGIGVVYGRSEVLEATPPWQGGGNMIADVTFERTQYQPPPVRFEAGTGNIADAVGLGAAVDYVERIGMANIARYEHDLLVYATEGLRKVPGLRLIGTAPDKAGVLSFVLDGYRTEDVGAALAREGIAVRAGHHCAQPILRRFGLESTVRPSLALYNTCQDIDAMVAALWRLKGGRVIGPL